MSTTLKLHEIGGGIVRQTFTNGVGPDGKPRQMRKGDRLTAAEILTFPAANRQALLEKYLDVYPKAPGERAAAAEPAPGERFVVPAAFGHFDVVEGHRVNDRPLKHEDALALAGVESQAAKRTAAGAAKRARRVKKPSGRRASPKGK